MNEDNPPTTSSYASRRTTTGGETRAKLRARAVAAAHSSSTAKPKVQQQSKPYDDKDPPDHSNDTRSIPSMDETYTDNDNINGGGARSQRVPVVAEQHSNPPPIQPVIFRPHENPIPPIVQRALGDRSYDKRKNAALEIESLVRSFVKVPVDNNDDDNSKDADHQAHLVQSVIHVLSKEFCTSMNANYRKGGLIGLAATAIGLMNHADNYLGVLLPPVLACFDDPESRVRYYACESLYNITKVGRMSVLRYFNQIFEGLCKLFADVDMNVKNGAGLLDRLIKDIVTENGSFNVELFIPLLQTYIKRNNPYIRQLLVGWITVLDSVPDINMIDWLPDFLDGLFNMLSDSNKEIRQAADSALSEFLHELKQASVVEFGPMIAILVLQCHSKERLNRLTAITWVAEFIKIGGDKILPFHSEILSAILRCISDTEVEIRQVAERTNDDLLSVVKETNEIFDLSPLLDTSTGELISLDVATKMAALRWINMLLEKRPNDMNVFLNDLLPVLLKTLSDSSDAVVLLNIQVLSRISLHEQEFKLVIQSILNLFFNDRKLLEARGSLVIRKLCALLNARPVYTEMATVLSKSNDHFSIEFVSTMVQILNLILLTAAELHELRNILKRSFQKNSTLEDREVFISLFDCWCHNAVSTFSFCLLAQAYDVAFSLIRKFSEQEVSVGFLMQVDKLVQLLESPVFIHLRLQLLDVDAPYHAPLLKSCYGLLMLLPQSDAYKALNDRLATVSNLKENIGIDDYILMDEKGSAKEETRVIWKDLDPKALRAKFDQVMEIHQVMAEVNLNSEAIN